MSSSHGKFGEVFRDTTDDEVVMALGVPYASDDDEDDGYEMVVLLQTKFLGEDAVTDRRLDSDWEKIS